MTKRIALVAPPWYPIPPDGYGGVELVVGLLAGALRERGHDVFVLAAEGSPLATRELAADDWADDLGQDGERRRELTYAARVARVLREEGGFDVIHEHCGWSTLLGVGLINVAPVVHTVHGPIPEIDVPFYRELPDSVGLVAISESQRGSAPDLRWVGVVHNAVDVEALEVSSTPDADAYLLCLARITPGKGQHHAIEVARRTGMRLILAGKVEPSEEGTEYFQRSVAPALDGERIVHVENVAGEEKARLLAGATALLAPLEWPEPFGLFMVEAMASGTPVVAFPAGAAGELVVDGETGFIVDDVEAMAAAVADKVPTIDRRRCAEIARERFSPAEMADGYLRVYEAVARSRA